MLHLQYIPIAMLLQVYKFDTIIQKNGIIRIPEFKQFIDCEVELFVVIKKKTPANSELSATSFVNRWAGFFKSDDADDARYSYLTEKYK